MSLSEGTGGVINGVASGFIDQRARREYVILCLATFLIFFTNAHAALLAVVFQSHGMPLSDVGIILSSYGVPVVIFTLLTGAVAGRIGPLLTLKIGVGFMALAFLSLQWTASWFLSALGSRVVQGVGYGLLFAPLMTYAQSRLSSHRFVYLLGVFSSMAPLAQAFGPPWADFIFFSFGDRYLFVIGVIPAIIGLGLLFLLRSETTAPATSLFNFKISALKDKGIGLLAIFVSGSIFGFLSSFMAGALHEKGLAIGWFFVASTAAMFTTRFLGLNHFGRFDLRVIVACGLALMGVGFAVVAWGSLAVHVAAGGLVFGAGYSVVYPVLTAWISEGLPSNERSGPQALFNAAFNAGLLLMPLPISYVVAWFGYLGALLSLSALGWGMAGLLIVSRSKRTKA
jgi:MFS family permease